MIGLMSCWLACAVSSDMPTTAPPTTIEDCGRYTAPALHAFCVTGLVTRGAIEPDACDGLGVNASACREAGVRRNLSQKTGSREDLLVACGESYDCALEVLDLRPYTDPSRQLEACRSHTGRFAEDCTIHALQRWAASKPDASSFARMARETAHGPAVGALLGLVVACQEVGSCELASPDAQEACRRAVDRDVPARPEICSLEFQPKPRK